MINIHYFLEKINQFRVKNSTLAISFTQKPEVLQQAIEGKQEAQLEIEYQLTLDELEAALRTVGTDEEREDALKKALATRWERIRGSFLDYTQRPADPMNGLCIEMANTLYPLPSSPNEIHALPLREGPYFLLMPSLYGSSDRTNMNIHHYRLHQMVLSDDQSLFIPIELCLDTAAGLGRNQLSHQVSEDEYRIQLGDTHRPDDGCVPDDTLLLYLADDVIYCAVKDKTGFVAHFPIPDEQLIDNDKRDFAAEIKRIIHPKAKQIPLSHDKRHIFCTNVFDTRPPDKQLPPGKLLYLSDNELGPSATAIHALLDQNKPNKPYLSMQGDHIVCVLPTDNNDKATMQLDDAMLGEAAAILKKILIPSGIKALSTRQDDAIFNAPVIHERGYRQKDPIMPPLSLTETMRVVEHSTATKHYYNAITAYNNLEYDGSFGGHLRRLARDLMAGGEHSGTGERVRKKRGPQVKKDIYVGEIMAGAIANVATVTFFNYWDDEKLITKEERIRLDRKFHINTTLERLTTPNTQCVEITAEQIESILRKYKDDPDLQPLIGDRDALLAQRETTQQQLNVALDSDNAPITRTETQAPDFVPALIKLYDDAPQTFHTLTTESQPIFFIIKHPLLASHALQQSIITEDAALLNACDTDGNTALNWAVLNNRVDLVKRLLAANIDMTLRNTEEQNALDIALDSDNLPLIKLLTLNAMVLSTEEQTKLLDHRSETSYTNVLFYVAENKPTALYDVYRAGNTQEEREYTEACTDYILHLSKQITRNNPYVELARAKRDIVMAAMQKLLTNQDPATRIETFKQELIKGIDTLATRRDSHFITFLKGLGVVAAFLLTLYPLLGEGGFIAGQRFFGHKATHGKTFLTEVGVKLTDKPGGSNTP